MRTAAAVEQQFGPLRRSTVDLVQLARCAASASCIASLDQPRRSQRGAPVDAQIRLSGAE